MRAQEPVRGRLFLPLRSCKIKRSGNFALRSHPDSLYLPYREPELARNLRITRSWARRSSNCSRLSEASVSELRCFNGFRLASGVGVATSSERSGLTVGVISTPTPAINASAVRASSNARSRGCVSNALASNHERRRTGSLRTSATTLGSVEGSPGLSSSRVEIGKCAIASALPRGKVA
jgi:hypothetical protein